ncbi:MAG: hypothetical protein U0R72_01810 [Nakamurella multipartita]
MALALQPSGQVIENLLARARPQMTVSVDPNLRPLLVPVASYRLWIDRWASLADIVRLSEDDLDLLAGLDAGAGRAAPARLRGAAGGGRPRRFTSCATLRVPIAPTTWSTRSAPATSFHGGLLHPQRAGQLGEGAWTR